MLRALLFSGCGLRAGVGADLAWPAEGGLDDAVELLVPVPFDALYPHYLCAKLDAALGETERYAGEQARYNSILAELSAWLWGDRIFEKCGIGRDERGDGGKTPEIRGKRRLSARDGGANYQQS